MLAQRFAGALFFSDFDFAAKKGLLLSSVSVIFHSGKNVSRKLLAKKIGMEKRHHFLPIVVEFFKKY